MNQLKRYIYLFLGFFILFFISISYVNAEDSNAVSKDNSKDTQTFGDNGPLTTRERAANYSDLPEVIEFIDKLIVKYPDMSREKTFRLFRKVPISNQLESKLFFSFKNPVAKRKTWEQYKNQFYNDTRIEAGIEFYKKHRKAIKEVSKKFKVSQGIILATLAIESYYGSVPYPYPVFNTLVITSFKKKTRTKFHRKQLEYFLVLMNKNKSSNKQILSIFGSYNGEIGPAQFIPFSVYHYGYDSDKDGKVDMATMNHDVFGSIANYYKKNGWKNSQKIEKSVTRVSKEYENHPDVFALIDKNNKKIYWKKFHNFKVILRYNRNNYYAFCVYLLASKFDSLLK